jgi:uncharacterized protein
MVLKPLSSLVTLFAIFLTGQAFAYSVPPNDGFVTDIAGILSEEEEASLEQVLSLYRQETSNEIAVLIVSTMQEEPLMEAAVDIGREWGVGTEENNNGIILLIAYEDREMFLATGYGLEGAVPDIVAKGIIERDITPFFKDGEYFEGIEAGILSLQKHIDGEYTAGRYNSGAMGMPIPFIVMIGIFMIIFGAFFVEMFLLELAPSRTWIMGGVMGFFLGMFFLELVGSWLVIPFYVVCGLVFDFFVSYLYRVDKRFARWVRRRKKRRRSSGGKFSSGGGFGGGSSGGGFGGGSFGGGGSGGRW